MDKRWLSQVMTDSGFPLLVLALAMTQINLGPRRSANLLGHDRQKSTEIRSNDRRPKEIGKYGSTSPSESPRVAERPFSTNK
ncbi:MAG: hypothetical protein JOZ31_14805 [Verrucomicrobia bacterium]|nr:hypothetical protein [Verrucomicrobiota bacterium]MBV8483064.1 hypothetical protein [Verrucomicrobiota bacterium]